MSLKDKVNEELEKRKSAEEGREEYREKIKTNLPLKCKEFMGWVEEICRDTGIGVGHTSEPVGLFLHSDGSPLGTVELDSIRLDLCENHLVFKPEPGVGYVRATGKISILTNVHNWQKKLDLAGEGVFVVFEDDFARSDFRYFDTQFQIHEFTKELLEKLIEAILLS